MNNTMLTSLIIVLLYGHVVTGKIAQADQILKDAAGVDMSCGSTGPWCDDEIYSKCMDNPDESTPGSKVCACDPDDEHISKHEGGKKSFCIKQVRLGSKCTSTAVNIECSDDNTVCIDQIWGFTTTERCACITGMAALRVSPMAEPNAVYKCGRRITGDECKPCEDGEGMCYEYFEDGTRTVKCHCPGSSSGEFCEVKHATVRCIGETMVVCYNAHPGYDLTTGSWFEVEGKGKASPACLGKIVGDNDPVCKPGESKLEIPYSDAGRATCGTTKSIYDDTWLRFTNTLAAHRSEQSHLTDEVISFQTYCMIQSHASGTMMPLKYRAGTALQGQVGDTSFPALSLIVKDVRGDHIGPTQSILSGDKVKIVFSIDPTSGYGSFVVEACLFSTEEDYRRSDAIRKPIITNRCPTPGQTVITLDNMFKPMSSSVQQTGFLIMKPLVAGVTTYLHCMVKVCLTGDESQCPETDCSGSRRRRAAGDVTDDETDPTKEVTISQTITIVAPKANDFSFDQIIGNEGTFITAICVILIVVVIVIIIVVVCAVRYWRRTHASNNKFIAGERSDVTPPPPYEHTRHAASSNPGFVPDQMRSYASQSVM